MNKYPKESELAKKEFGSVLAMTPAEVPTAKKVSKYAPAIAEFLDSNEKSVEVHLTENHRLETVSQGLKKAIENKEAPVRVRTLKDENDVKHLYLERTDTTTEQE